MGDSRPALKNMSILSSKNPKYSTIQISKDSLASDLVVSVVHVLYSEEFSNPSASFCLNTLEVYFFACMKNKTFPPYQSLVMVLSDAKSRLIIMTGL